MRPKDENQHGSMRPNLMSSARRASSEENILAMLERDSARRNSSTRMAWYGAGSALALVLVAVLAWIGWDNGGLREDQLLTPIAVAASVPAAPAADGVGEPASPGPVLAAQAPLLAQVQPARAATIVDTAPEDPHEAAGAAQSASLVLLSPEQATRKAASAAGTRGGARPATAAALKAEPARAAGVFGNARTAAHAHVGRPAARAPAPARARKASGSRGGKPLATASHGGNPEAATSRGGMTRAGASRGGKSLATPSHGRKLRPVSHVKKARPPSADAGSAAAEPADPPPDRDVALISAILGRSQRPHAGGHP